MSKHVAVLLGGWSAERAVSLVSGASVAEALRARGHRVTEIDVDRDVAQQLHTAKPDVVFNALHGRFGEDGTIQGLLEVMGLPYTHSGVLASAMAMDKPTAKKIFERAGIRCTEGRVMSRADFRNGNAPTPPYVLKPLNEGSSVGVRLISAGDNTSPIDDTWDFGDSVLVEDYVPGREITVAVLGDRALGVTEISSDHRFFDPFTCCRRPCRKRNMPKRWRPRSPRTPRSAAAGCPARISATTTVMATVISTSWRSTRSPV